MKPIYLANNGGIYHFCTGAVEIKFKTTIRKNVYRSYYKRNKDNFQCHSCSIIIPGLFFVTSTLKEKYKGIILYYTEGADSFISKKDFKKHYNPKQIWSVKQEIRPPVSDEEGEKER